MSKVEVLRKVALTKPFLMVASVGNPESSFGGTRHNVGHWGVNYMHEVWTTTPFQKTPGADCVFSVDQQREDIVFYKSTSYMNISGPSLSRVWQKISQQKKQQGYSPALVVIHDELSYDLGTVKVRKQNTSHRGHNGLKSIQGCMGAGFTRIGIGIGRPESRDPNIVAKYVLSKFTRKESELLDHQVGPQISLFLEQMRQGHFIYEKNTQT